MSAYLLSPAFTNGPTQDLDQLFGINREEKGQKCHSTLGTLHWKYFECQTCDSFLSERDA